MDSEMDRRAKAVQVAYAHIFCITQDCYKEGQYVSFYERCDATVTMADYILGDDDEGDDPTAGVFDPDGGPPTEKLEEPKPKPKPKPVELSVLQEMVNRPNLSTVDS